MFISVDSALTEILENQLRQWLYELFLANVPRAQDSKVPSLVKGLQ